MTEPHAPREIACAGKDRLTADRAKEIAQRSRRHKDNGPHLAAYKCHHCGGWHIGTSQNGVKAKRYAMRGEA